MSVSNASRWMGFPRGQYRRSARLTPSTTIKVERGEVSTRVNKAYQSLSDGAIAGDPGWLAISQGRQASSRGLHPEKALHITQRIEYLCREVYVSPPHAFLREKYLCSPPKIH